MDQAVDAMTPIQIDNAKFIAELIATDENVRSDAFDFIMSLEERYQEVLKFREPDMSTEDRITLSSILLGPTMDIWYRMIQNPDIDIRLIIKDSLARSQKWIRFEEEK